MIIKMETQLNPNGSVDLGMCCRNKRIISNKNGSFVNLFAWFESRWYAQNFSISMRPQIIFDAYALTIHIVVFNFQFINWSVLRNTWHLKNRNINLEFLFGGLYGFIE